MTIKTISYIPAPLVTMEMIDADRALSSELSTHRRALPHDGGAAQMPAVHMPGGRVAGEEPVTFESHDAPESRVDGEIVGIDIRRAAIPRTALPASLLPDAAEIPAIVLFSGAHEALVYAHNFSGQQFAHTALAKMMKHDPGRPSSGKGLIGLDGAGQAGMILATVARLERAGQQCVTARYAPKTKPCSCCSADAPTPEWREAVEGLTFWVITSLSGITHLHLRRALVGRYFGSKADINEVAHKCGVHRSTVSAQNSVIVKALRDLESRTLGQLEDDFQKTGVVAKIS